jgi:type IV pilus assembly protein PilX
MKYSSSIGKYRQQGAALVVGMLLLIVITLLAISSMNASTLELQMAGNNQFRQNSFQAAEIGIEQAMQTTTLTTDATVTTAVTSVGAGSSDTYQVSTYHSCAAKMAAPAIGFDTNLYSNYVFDATSTGNSARGAQSQNTLTFYVVGAGKCD